MKVVYLVHSAVVEAMPVTATLDGYPITATVRGLTVELLSEGDVEHGHTFRLIPKTEEDMDANCALFTPGNRVAATFSREEESEQA